MIIRFANDTEIANWDKLVANNPEGGNFLQGTQFAQQKQDAGWTPRLIVAGAIAIMGLEKTVPLLGKLWYIPKGPGVATTAQMEELYQPLTDFARQHGVFTIKLEPELLRTDKNDQALRNLGLVSVTPIQPNFSTVIVDISSDLPTLLAALPQKGRYAIKRAERDGVTVKQVGATDENCRLMYNLLTETANDAKFGIRSFDYYRTYWQRFEQAGQGQLFFAYYDDQFVAGAFAVAFGHKSTYKDGASIRKRTAYGASHLLQWHVIQWAKSKGSVSHDLCGAPPASQVDNKEHRYYGMGLFKRSFNPEITEFVGAYELPVKPFAHMIWRRIGERLVRGQYIRKHHEDYY
jgi:lipid II:glycine glycyltransferase (peptidoglycan interpeptide bridge formation enzyme)